MRSQSILLATCLAIAVAGCSTAQAESPSANALVFETVPEGWPMVAISTVARVDGVELQASLFNAEVESLMLQRLNLSRLDLEFFKTTTVGRLIDQHLWDKALSTENYTATDSEFDDELNRAAKAEDGPESPKQFFSRVGIRSHHAREDVGRAIKLKKLIRKKYGAAVTEAVAHIKARRAETLVFFRHEQMLPEFSDAAFAAKVGEVVGPVRTQFGFQQVEFLHKALLLQR